MATSMISANFILLSSDNKIISLNGNGSTIQALSFFGISVPSGYSIVSVTPIITGADSTGNSVTKIMGSNGSTDDSAVSIGIRNLSTSSVNWTVKVKMLIMKQ